MRLLDHPDVPGFLRTLGDNPGSAHHALVFADWLDENGFPAHAEMIRLHHSQWGAAFPGGEGGLTQSRHIADKFTTDSYNRATTGNSVVTVDLPMTSGRSRLFNAMLPSNHAKHLYNSLKEEGAEGMAG